MKTAAEYRQYAQECRQLAAKMDSAKQRAELLKMAEHWERLALEPGAPIKDQPERA